MIAAPGTGRWLDLSDLGDLLLRSLVPEGVETLIPLFFVLPPASKGRSRTVAQALESATALCSLTRTPAVQ